MKNKYVVKQKDKIPSSTLQHDSDNKIETI
jgi:hypothetical protein